MAGDAGPPRGRKTTVFLVLFVAGVVGAHGLPGRAAELPEPGGLSALPAEAGVSLRLVNPGFEQGAEGWDLRQAALGIAHTQARTGRASLRFDASVPTRYTPSVRQLVRGIEPGIYVLRFGMKMRGLRPPDKGSGGVRVSLEYHLKDGRRRWPSTSVFNGTADWRTVELKALIPRSIKDDVVAISVHRYGKPTAGEAWFDDFSLERIADPPVEAFLLYPNYRGYLPADGPQRVRLWVRANDPERGGKARVEVQGDGGRLLASRDLPQAVQEAVVEFVAARWPPGRYSVVARLGDYSHPAYVVEKITAEQRRRLAVWFDEHNVLHFHGRRVFPIGFYNTVRQFAVVDEGEFARLDKLAEAPVGLMINYTWWPCSLADRRRYLAEMHKRGIAYLDTVMPFKPGKVRLAPQRFPIATELLPSAGGRLDTQEACDRFLTALGQRMRSMPAHAGWYVMDERPFDLVPAIFHQCGVLRHADPDHPTYGVSNRPEELFKWRDTLDVFGLDPYPLFNMKAGRPLSLVGEWTRAGVEATHGSRPLWMVIQFFQGRSTDRWPTEEELRTMSLMAIAEGARGLFHWSFGARALLWVKDPAKREEYWSRVARVARELKSIEPALIAPDAPRVVESVSDHRVRWRARQADGKWYVFAYLPAAKFSERFEAEPIEVTFTLADGQRVRRRSRPDTADWFCVSPRKSR